MLDSQGQLIGEAGAALELPTPIAAPVLEPWQPFTFPKASSC